MTRTAVALRHVHFEDLGLVEPLLRERGYRVRYVDVGIDDLRTVEVAEADLLVVLGGPVGVGDLEAYPFLADELALLTDRLGRLRPTLGICLGAQLVATALGARVRPSGGVEIGYAPLRLGDAGLASVLAPIDGVPVLHWHGDIFDLPEGATLLASTDRTPHQAFTVGSHVLALQLHLEVDHTRIERWLVGHAYELATHGIDPRTIREDAAAVGPRLAQRARTTFAAWLDALDVEG